jgi:hypothetical protein
MGVMVSSPTLLTEYAVGRDVLKSTAKKPDIAGRRFIEDAWIPMTGSFRDHRGKTWPVYLRAEVEGAYRVREGRRKGRL